MPNRNLKKYRKNRPKLRLQGRNGFWAKRKKKFRRNRKKISKSIKEIRNKGNRRYKRNLMLISRMMLKTMICSEYITLKYYFMYHHIIYYNKIIYSNYSISNPRSISTGFLLIS